MSLIRTSFTFVVTLAGLAVASNAAAQARDVEAGPIWNNRNANHRCPEVCSANGATWNGQWRTTIQGTMSVCSCVFPAPPPPPPPPPQAQPIAVPNLAGRWTDNAGVTITITQSGANLSAAYSNGRGPFAGTVDGSGNVAINFTDDRPYLAALRGDTLFWNNATRWTRVPLGYAQPVGPTTPPPQVPPQQPPPPPPPSQSACAWLDGQDPSARPDSGRGVSDWSAHYGFGTSGLRGRAPDFIASRMEALRGCLPAQEFARLYADVSTQIGYYGRTYAGWSNGMDGRFGSDRGRGIAGWQPHFEFASDPQRAPMGTMLVRQRMVDLSGTLPAEVYGRLYADVSILIARFARSR